LPTRAQGFSKVDELGHFDESARRNLSGCTPVTGERFLPLVEMTTGMDVGSPQKTRLLRSPDKSNFGWAAEQFCAKLADNSQLFMNLPQGNRER
jgi:hypothetical protein